ncbi:MAG TPA: winged helix-turn-helix domain-containing protein [Nitrososphaeraceae archaeon]|nr:winged helix-turn-helix domain-containing protein [Nitrososphaeraceae archaeon]
MVHEYRDRTYIRKDILVLLAEYSELNQTKLLSYCGLNLAKHKKIIDELSEKGLIEKNESKWGSKIVVNYKITEKGRKFCKMVLDPYEEMFPRNKKQEEKKRMDNNVN